MNVEIPRNTNATSSFDIPYSVFDIQNSLKVNGIELAPAFHPRHLSAQEVRAIRGWHCPKDTLVVAKAKLGLEPRFRKKVWCANARREPNANAVKGLEPDDRNRFGGLDCQA